MSKVSIIIPIYNASKYLRQTLDSIIAQDYENWEALLIDDGSSDESGIICDEYAKKDRRIIPIHKTNGGVSSARNVGLARSSGKYICFLDSDDRMKPNLISTCVQMIGNAQLLIFGFERWNYRNDKMVLDSTVIKGAQECHDYLYNLKEDCLTSEFFCFPWNKLYTRSLLVNNDITFPVDISFREDEIFAYRYLPFVSEIVVISDTLIEYNDEPAGLSSKSLRPEKSLALAKYLIDQAKSNISKKSKTILIFRAMVYMIDAINNTSTVAGKTEIAKSMIKTHRIFQSEYDSSQIAGKFRKFIKRALDRQSIISILIIAYMTSFIAGYRKYIKRDSNYKHWGVNV